MLSSQMSFHMILAGEAHFRIFTIRDGAHGTGRRIADTLLDIIRMSGGNMSPHVSPSSSTMSAGVNWASDSWVVGFPVSTERVRG